MDYPPPPIFRSTPSPIIPYPPINIEIFSNPNLFSILNTPYPPPFLNGGYLFYIWVNSSFFQNFNFFRFGGGRKKRSWIFPIPLPLSPRIIFFKVDNVTNLFTMNYNYASDYDNLVIFPF